MKCAFCRTCKNVQKPEYGDICSYCLNGEYWELNPELCCELDNRIQALENEIDYDKVQRHKVICDGIHELYKRKNHDYGDSFGESFRDYGPLAGMIRMEDKFNRLKTLLRGADQQVEDETVTDTLRDLANYAIMTLLEMEG